MSNKETQLAVDAQTQFDAMYSAIRHSALVMLASLTGRSETNAMFAPLTQALDSIEAEVRQAHRSRYIALAMADDDMRNHGQPVGQST